MNREPWLLAHFGRDWMRGRGWIFYAAVIPARDLMGLDDEGCLILAALHVEISADFQRWPWVRMWTRSDVSEIATRRSKTATHHRKVVA